MKAFDLVRQVRLLDPMHQQDVITDVLLGDGIVQAIAPSLECDPETTQLHDGTDAILGPGLVDLYSTVGEPGFESRETLASIAAAAAAGGFTQLGLLPGTDPPIDRPEQVAWMRSHWPSQSPVTLELWGGLTQNLKGQQLVDVAELLETDVCGLCDGVALESMALVRRVLDYRQPCAKPLAIWPCYAALASAGVIRAGLQAIQTGLPENPVMSETAALAALLEMLQPESPPVHIMRVSTARSVELLAAAKSRGLPVTASVSWMHLLFNSEDLRTYDVNLRLDPPCGNPSDQAALIQGLETDVVDAIAIDHQPFTYEEKTVAFAEAPPGAIGLELALPILWQTFVVTERWSALKLWSKLSQGPRTCLGQPIIAPTVGAPLNLILFQPNQSWQVTSAQLQSLAHNTPWLGQPIQGRVRQIWTAHQTWLNPDAALEPLRPHALE